ncbi:thioredoxin family protein [Sulfurimonas sp.]|jgi:thioredoxin-related protein|uniref:thioredoxin family protein n=1 Tax=Sulfurimonas sp. TaxID=2022749 RepID=UPI0025E0CE6D|nr:thioredoxin family protein [Sulfurimonas sp.]MCK9472111.1 thioredoxin family protein [Sulfurimonas sp.]MDD3505834.1 thioredoxin family protein [Sulfurimonas sp.]
MKLFALLFTLLATLYSAELNWLNDYDKALQQAQKQNKGVYLFIGADVCRWCDRFKELTLSKKEVIDRLQEEYVLLYLSRDKHQIPKRFKTQGVPRHYFLTNRGEIIHADNGSREVDGFLNLLEEVDLKK